MTKKDKTKTNKQKKQSAISTKQKILYGLSVVVILVPLLLLGYIYLSTKENAGIPTVGSRFDNELDPAITEEQVDQIKQSLTFDEAEHVEVNLKSATVRVTIDLEDKAGNKTVTSVMNEAYDKVTKVLPVETYFTNKDETKMYDLEVSVYNFIPEEDNTDGWVYKTKIKNASAKKAFTDVLSKPKNQDVADTIEKEQDSIK